MTDKPLWSDDKINNLAFKNANNLDPDARWMHEQIVKDMRNDYERAIALRNQASMQAAESIKDLLGRITELERQGEKREAELIKQVDIVIDLQQYITELEQRRADLAADIPTVSTEDRANPDLPMYDPVYVRTLQQAYCELQAQQSEFWLQLNADQKYSQEDKEVFIENQGQWVGIQRGNVVLGVWLNELGCAVMRKVKP